jgi:hypothetical protein
VGERATILLPALEKSAAFDLPSEEEEFWSSEFINYFKIGTNFYYFN